MDDKLLVKSSLDIDLLPETKEDRQMASLMKLQSKSAQEREEEKRIDILLKPALPGATQTTFGGTKRQKALGYQLQYEQLGIKRRHPTNDSNREDKEENALESSKNVESINKPPGSAFATCSSVTQEPRIVNLPKSLALVCDYTSSNSQSENDSE